MLILTIGAYDIIFAKLGLMQCNVMILANLIGWIWLVVSTVGHSVCTFPFMGEEIYILFEIEIWGGL
jgi:hypothetical protein